MCHTFLEKHLNLHDGYFTVKEDVHDEGSAVNLSMSNAESTRTLKNLELCFSAGRRDFLSGL